MYNYNGSNNRDNQRCPDCSESGDNCDCGDKTSMTKQQAIETHIRASYPEAEVTESAYCDSTFDIEGEEWLVLTDDEADKRAGEQVEQSLWAFNWSFLAGHCDAIDAIGSTNWAKMMSDMCEDGNDVVKRLLGDRLDRLVGDAILADGRGHFLSIYDGDEVELGDRIDFYGYRIS